MKLCTSFRTRLGSQGRLIFKMANTGTPQLITFKLLSFCSVLRPDVYDNFYVNCTALIVFFLKSSGRNNAKYAFQYTIGKKEEEGKREQIKDLHDDIRGGLPIQFLTRPDRA